MLVLAIAGIAYRHESAALQALTGGLWALLIAVPRVLGRLSGSSALRFRYDRASRYMQLAWLLQPFDGRRFNRQILSALALAQRGELERAKAKLAALSDDPRTLARERPVIRAHLPRLSDDWEGLASIHGDGGANDSIVLLTARMRALGETGRLHEMVVLLERDRSAMGPLFLLCRLYGLAFCGRIAAVERLLPLMPLDAASKEFWLATAELVGGERDRALALLAGIARSANAITASAAERRRSVALASPRGRLTTTDWQVVADIEVGLDGDAAYISGRYAGIRRSYVILGLILVNVAAYLVELARGVSQDKDGLLLLGALRPDYLFERGDWWRLATTIFLHYGWLHLLLNMFALGVIGTWVERMLGRWRTLFIYFAAGLGSAAFVAQSLPPDTVTVGACGAILGLVGGQIVLLVQGWRRHRSRHAGRRLFDLGLVILLQVAFNLATPEVSVSAHAAGLVIGLAAATLAMLGHRPADAA